MLKVSIVVCIVFGIIGSAYYLRIHGQLDALKSSGTKVLPVAKKKQKPKRKRVRKKSQASSSFDEADMISRLRKCGAGMMEFCDGVEVSDGSDDAEATPENRHLMQGKALEEYFVDSHSLQMAFRTARNVGNRDAVGGHSLELYKGVVSRAERSCRFRVPLACLHRGQIATFANEKKASRWLRKAKIYAGDEVKKCRGKQSPDCSKLKALLNQIQAH